MSSAAIPHLYAVLGDGRLNIIGSKAGLESLSAALKTLSTSGKALTYELTAAEMPYYGLSAARLSCRKDDQPLHCTVVQSTVQIVGNKGGLLFLASALDWQAKEWNDGGHQHVYAGQEFSDGRNGYLTSPDSEEVLIGGQGYLPPEMFGLAPEE